MIGKKSATIEYTVSQYFSPEQAAGLSPTPASDVYGLGVVLYEMLTGRLPFIANTAAELSHMHRMVMPTPPSQISPLIPPVLEEACLKVLSKEPSSRYRTADQFGRVLIALNRSIKASSNQTTSTVKASSDEFSHLPTQKLPAQRQTQQHPTTTHQKTEQETYLPINTSSTGKSSAKIANTRNGMDIDWRTWVLVFFTVITVGGLVPFWVWIYLLYNPPGR